MKVIHFQFGKEGGAERFFVQLVNAFARRGLEQTIVIRPGRLWRDEVHPSIDVIESNFRNLSLDRLLLPLKVKRLAETMKPNAIFSWATRASRLMPKHPSAIKLSRLGDYPTNLDYFKNTDVLVCNTPGIATHVKSMGWTRGVEVISNFTDDVRVSPIDRGALNTPESALVVMSMGRFVPRKEFPLLVSAVARIPGAYLWLAGEGDERANIEKTASELGVLDRVRFLGWQKNVRPYLAAADIFVMPSRHEPLGNVILEAWAQDRPVISTRAEGPIWFMRDGMNGLLVKIGDAEGLARAIGRLKDDAPLRDRLAAGGRETLMKQFSEAAIVDAYVKLFGSSPEAYRSSAADPAILLGSE